jgi:hypothetical protein
MSSVVEIEDALKGLPLQDAQKVAQWLQNHLDQRNASPKQTRVKLPDYAARRRVNFGDKVLPNMVVLSREQERW